EVARDKDRFAEANVALVQEYKKIKNLIGTPENEEKKTWCRYQSRKFSRGRLSCGISIFSYYPLSQWKHVVQKLERNYGIRDKFNETHLSFYANELEESVE